MKQILFILIALMLSCVSFAHTVKLGYGDFNDDLK